MAKAKLRKAKCTSCGKAITVTVSRILSNKNLYCSTICFRTDKHQERLKRHTKS